MTTDHPLAPTDRLTQLQDCLDQLATQMFACLRYINTHHAASPIPGQQFERHFGSTVATLGPGNINPSANEAVGTPVAVAAAGATTPAAAPSTPAPGTMNDTLNVNPGTPAATAAAPAGLNDSENPTTTLAQNNSSFPAGSLPDDPLTFAAALRELSRDLVLKEQQIELIVRSLPGAGRSTEEQEGRLRMLETELREVEGEVEEWGVVKEGLVERVEGAIGRCWRP